MFKYLQLFPFIDKDRYCTKHSEKITLILHNIKNILELYGQGSLNQNIGKIIEPKHKFYQKGASIYKGKYSYIDSTSNKSFFNELKQFYKNKLLSKHVEPFQDF